MLSLHCAAYCQSLVAADSIRSFPLCFHPPRRRMSFPQITKTLQAFQMPPLPTSLFFLPIYHNTAAHFFWIEASRLCRRGSFETGAFGLVARFWPIKYMQVQILPGPECFVLFCFCFSLASEERAKYWNSSTFPEQYDLLLNRKIRCFTYSICFSNSSH